MTQPKRCRRLAKPRPNQRSTLNCTSLIMPTRTAHNWLPNFLQQKTLHSVLHLCGRFRHAVALFHHQRFGERRKTYLWTYRLLCTICQSTQFAKLTVQFRNLAYVICKFLTKPDHQHNPKADLNHDSNPNLTLAKSCRLTTCAQQYHPVYSN